MKIYHESIGHYIQWMEMGKRFSLAGFSDAEWYCVLGQRIGELTGLGQVLSAEHGELLADVLRRRQSDPRFLVAVPACINTLPGFNEGQIDWWLGRQNIVMEAYERDEVTDDLARRAELFPFIRQLHHMDVTVIGPSTLALARPVMKYKKLIEISTPNLHLEPLGIDDAVRRAIQWGRPGVYLVSAGVSAAVIIDRLHDRIGNSWFMDCGSMWDAFCGTGGQRQWRADLYADPKLLAEWKRQNICGKREGVVHDFAK